MKGFPLNRKVDVPHQFQANFKKKGNFYHKNQHFESLGRVCQTPYISTTEVGMKG